MTVMNVTLYSTICLMHRSVQLSFLLLYRAGESRRCVRFCYIKMPSDRLNRTLESSDTKLVCLYVYFGELVFLCARTHACVLRVCGFHMSDVVYIEPPPPIPRVLMKMT